MAAPWASLTCTTTGCGNRLPVCAVCFPPLITTRPGTITPATRGAEIKNRICYTGFDAFSRFACCAVVPRLNQLYLRLSCPPFYSAPNQTKCERLKTFDVRPSVGRQPLQKKQSE